MIATQGQGDRSEQQSRVYGANAYEVVQDVTVITGTLLLNSVPAIVLFNSCSTHTFIAHIFIPRIGIGLEDLD